MVVNIRGTGGSGKSHLVREVMAHYARRREDRVAGRARPLGYWCERPGASTLYVPGHYETACGGCDTIKTPDEAYALVEREVGQGHDVLYEGIIIQDEWRRCAALAGRTRVEVIALDVPMDVCLQSIRQRREARGDARELNPTNTVNRARRLKGTMEKLRAEGVSARWMSREDAWAEVALLLALGDERSTVEERQTGDQGCLW